MKKFLLALLIALTPLALFGCGDDSATPTENQDVAFQTMSGVVRKLGASIYAEGTHRLEKDGQLVALLEAASPQINLNDFVGDTVEVEGVVSPTTEGNLQIMRVVTVTPEGGAVVSSDSTSQYEKFSDEQFGFSVKYPTELTLTQTRRGAAFYDGDQKVIELVVLENPTKQELSDWLIDNYNYTADALRRVSVAGLMGYQFQNTTGSVIYLGDGGQIFTLAWYDNSEENRARNRNYYLEFVQSFVVSGIDSGGTSVEPTSVPGAAAKGEFCGGIAAITCAGGLDCRLSGSYPDAGGICVAAATAVATTAVTSDQIASNNTLESISAGELQRGWYYGDRDTKKPGTPDTWILVDSGTRASMWRRVDITAEPTITLPEATATTSQLASAQQKVLDYLATNINSLSPEVATDGAWELQQLAFADPNFVYAVFSAGQDKQQTRRLLFVYTIVGDKVSVEMQAFFKVGTEKDWLVVEGADTAFGKAQTIVNTQGEITSSVSAGYRLFTDYPNGFAFEYPKDWYWQRANSTKIEFSNQPFPAGIAILTAQIMNGNDFSFGTKTTEKNETVIYGALNSVKSVRFSINDLDYLDVLEAASKSLTALN